MKTLQVKAIFKGADGSCGYTHGKEYTLTVWQHSEMGFSNIAIETKPDENYCEYETIIGFLNNWDCIRNI